ncbi:Pyruvate/2-oxoglutarate/acetoin dehydrogenase complex, dehydrogenase (E1) component [Catalinimonas alkaloidigena]|uniref:Pyruvate/2-oxoglutarate/acetoin dehydrogenase complex, dehydrogenase (E1) component n=1 Tax=Catalinimonas alkaloidigena TaxID=1075417 RepID=A0A1G9BWE6_9BACT|nr:alpha-ketoacid dehydrogenase subunit alpha/beta [Catalinimonas alkaloidigena]SDK43713.1 Pyruvate/2-oxoglutarate/acetoin dehydrogenase complex, dehydrogenase (E1) component [Catalinimonas alkaloidigena]
MDTVTLTENLTREQVLRDYRIACESREVSLLGRKEVFMGKAKFGIFGDGKEVAQLAMARVFRNGDFRSGYYRDQTFMSAIGELTWQQYFAQLYAHVDEEADPASAGRQMNSHFATHLLERDGSWRELVKLKNVISDLSPTAGQIPRLIGLAYASKLYRQNPDLKQFAQFSENGNEIAFGTIGNASTSEGIFLEAINAAGVLQIPLLMSVWDDGYGISVPNEYHTTKGSISEALAGFQRTDEKPGFEIFTVRGWDYEALCEAYRQAASLCRREHVPVLLHVIEMTQPQGHSTSGSHERYKSKERLTWEKKFDCILKMREWMLDSGLAEEDELVQIEKESKEVARQARNAAWKTYLADTMGQQQTALRLLEVAARHSPNAATLRSLRQELQKTLNPVRSDAVRTVRKALRILRNEPLNTGRQQLLSWYNAIRKDYDERYSSHLHSESADSALRVATVAPAYSDESPLVDGREVIQACFDAALGRDPRIFAFGEDVGQIGDVNQGMAGLQAKWGELRVTDTGIREPTIIGQGVGTALRGLRPIAEIQYLDYTYYALQTLSDDLASLHYRTKGRQKAPVIIRTRGHRLEGIWHSGSPIGALLHSLRGIYLLVPRNMTQAAGFYNVLLQADDPALVIESLNAYRLKERLPDNVGEFTIPLGVPEVLRAGQDLTVVTYGSMCRIVLDAAEQLAEYGIDCEVIDVQTLSPFDIHHSIVESVKKTNRVIFADEDVPGGASAYMMQQVIEGQGAYRYLDSEPRTLSARAHRPAYGSDGDYFSKPNLEDVFELAYALMHEADPQRFPALFD